VVIRKIAQEIFRRGSRYAYIEAKFWRGLYGPSGRYPGVSNYRQASKGVQHGLASGAAIGSFINEGENPELVGQVPYESGSPSSSSNQAYRGRGGFAISKCHKNVSCCHCRE